MDLLRVEAAMRALSRGLASGWAVDHVIALGWAWRFNALGASLCHAESFKTHDAKRQAKEALCREILHQKIVTNGSDAWDMANEAVEWWLDKWCPACNGTGCDFHQVQCSVCDGLKTKPVPLHLERTVVVIDASLEWLEGQINKSMRHWTPDPKTATYQVHSSDASVYGWVTPKARVEY